MSHWQNNNDSYSRPSNAVSRNVLASRAFGAMVNPKKVTATLFNPTQPNPNHPLGAKGNNSANKSLFLKEIMKATTIPSRHQCCARLSTKNRARDVFPRSEK